MSRASASSMRRPGTPSSPRGSRSTAAAGSSGAGASGAVAAGTTSSSLASLTAATLDGGHDGSRGARIMPFIHGSELEAETPPGGPGFS